VRCDVCNVRMPIGSGERITPEIFVYLLDNGFGLDESNIKMFTDAGMSRSEAESELKEQYRSSNSDWLLCSTCAAKAKAISERTETWVTPDYISVTRTAEEVGAGFIVLGAPVAISRAVWEECVEWTDRDSEHQTYQEQDARLWDVLFTGGTTLQLAINQFVKERAHRYPVLCVLRDGISTDSVTVNLLMQGKQIRGQSWLVIERDG